MTAWEDEWIEYRGEDWSCPIPECDYTMLHGTWIQNRDFHDRWPSGVYHIKTNHPEGCHHPKDRTRVSLYYSIGCQGCGGLLNPSSPPITWRSYPIDLRDMNIFPYGA